MFGDDDQNQNDQQTDNSQQGTVVEPTATQTDADDASTHDSDTATPASDLNDSASGTGPMPSASSDEVHRDNSFMGSSPINDTPAPSFDSPAPVSEPAASPDPAATGSDDLLDIKKKALEQLTPLVGKLDQSPEEKFRTTMMMIQASDNQTLIKDAYEAAQSIVDEKEKAQALLDIINEINYFTQSKV